MKKLMVLCLGLLSFAGFADDVVPVDKVRDSVNVRQKPETTSEIVGRLNQGASLPLVNTLDGWYEVQLEGDATGFVSADWARVVSAGSADDSLEATPPADVKAAAPTTADTVVEEEGAPVAEISGQLGDEVAEDVAAGSDEVAEEGAGSAGTGTAEEIAAPAIVAEVRREEAVEVDIVKEATAAVETEVVRNTPPPPGPPGAANIKGSQNFLVKFRKETEGGNSQIYDNGNQVGIGTTEPKQRLEVNGSIQIHEQNSSVAGLMITQSSGETGYIMHNRASTLTIGAGSRDRITIDREGNVGIGVARPSHPLQMASGAHLSAGGVWTNSSSRDKKENVAPLSLEQAMAAVAELEPVLFNYRNERQEGYVGFIAEDVPELVASRKRDTLSPMDIVAVLTKVVQAQQQRIEELEARLDATRPGR